MDHLFTIHQCIFLYNPSDIDLPYPLMTSVVLMDIFNECDQIFFPIFMEFEEIAGKKS